MQLFAEWQLQPSALAAQPMTLVPPAFSKCQTTSCGGIAGGRGAVTGEEV